MDLGPIVADRDCAWCGKTVCTNSIDLVFLCNDCKCQGVCVDICKRCGIWYAYGRTATDDSVMYCNLCLKNIDPYNPPHYTRLKPELISVVESWGLGYHLGNALKYISRAGHKDDEIQDLKKAIWYLERLVKVKEKKK